MSLSNRKLFLAALILGIFVLGVNPAKASTFCFCYDDPEKITILNYETAETDFISTGLKYCEEAGKVRFCNPDIIERIGGKKSETWRCSPAEKLVNSTSCRDELTIWQRNKEAKLKAGIKSEEGTRRGLGAFLPACVNTEEGCRDAGVFVAMGINIADYLLGIIGALALLMFIYGGFTLVLSGGNPEKVKKGGTILLSALIGLIIVFGAYMLVKFLGGAVGLKGGVEGYMLN